MSKLLIVDDEPSICWGLKRLGEEAGHHVWTAASAEEGLELAERHQPDVLLLDVRLPGLDGLSALKVFRQRWGSGPVIVMTAFGDLQTAVQAIQQGASDYLTKPFDLIVAEKSIQRALDQRASLAGEAETIGRPEKPAAPEPPASATANDELLGGSAVMQQVFKSIAVAAGASAAVLIQGESGTGKELAAAAIHRYSSRASGPFVPVNIAALSPSLAESELFGHVRGAYTGAEGDRAGLLVQADGGTLFLDEVADIPLHVQVKLLRCLETGQVTPVGANQPRPSNFRVISATHRDLQAAIAEGTFRHDLYFRLTGFRIQLPPLRERPGDVRELANHFLQRFTPPAQKGQIALSPAALAELERRPWHGNVRELRNTIEHAVLVARNRPIRPDDFPAPFGPVAEEASWDSRCESLIHEWVDRQWQEGELATDLHERFLQSVEPKLFAEVLARSQGQWATAARQLGIHRTTLKKKFEQQQ